MCKDTRCQVSGVSTTTPGNMKEEKNIYNLCVLRVSVVRYPQSRNLPGLVKADLRPLIHVETEFPFTVR